MEDRVEQAFAGTDARDLHRQILESVEKPLISAVLAHTDGNQIRAAGLLGINRNTLRKKIFELGIELPTRNKQE